MSAEAPTPPPPAAPPIAPSDAAKKALQAEVVAVKQRWGSEVKLTFLREKSVKALDWSNGNDTPRRR